MSLITTRLLVLLTGFLLILTPIPCSGAMPAGNYHPALAHDPRNNRYLLAWLAADGERNEVRGRFVTAAGVPVGRAFALSGPAAVTDGSGLAVGWDERWERFWVVWEDEGGGAGSPHLGRLVRWDGVTLGEPFPVVTEMVANLPRTVGDAFTAAFVLPWQNDGGDVDGVVDGAGEPEGNPVADTARAFNRRCGNSVTAAVLGGEGGPSLTTVAAGTPCPAGAVLNRRDRDFGHLAVGTVTPSQPLRLANEGETTLHLGSVSLAGPAPRDFSITGDGCSGRSLPPGQECSVEIAFVPAGLGPRDALLVIAPAGTDAPPVLVPLAGTGTLHALLREEFADGWLPLGWTALVGGASAAEWRFDDPGERANRTGAGGGFASIDSDLAGGGATDAELRTPLLHFSGHRTAFLAFSTDYIGGNGSDVAQVEVSVNGDYGPWTPVWRRSGVDQRGPDRELVDLSPLAAGRANVMVRFRYRAGFDGWWQLDDVEFGALEPAADGS